MPLIYLKDSKALRPPGTNPAWFHEDGVALAKTLATQGALALYINDLNIPQTGHSDNFPVIREIKQTLNAQLWVTGNFQTLTALEAFAELGVDKINVGALAYQNPQVFQEACQQWPQKIAAPVEVRHGRVVIPGMAAPAHKKPADYAKRFEEAGAAALCFTEGDHNFQNVKTFCTQVKVPVLALNEPATTGDLEKFFEMERAGLIGVVMGKSLYETRLDLHSSIAFLNDLAVATTQEPTLTED
ncbi:MAG: tRNA-dihydrouridine synthase [Deltaproteobacteria bacterium]|nr:tRNA-dihydrouridine synthase [Deltaproteobacteria bacterium]